VAQFPKQLLHTVVELQSRYLLSPAFLHQF
jgi:hypothetical protein